MVIVINLVLWQVFNLTQAYFYLVCRFSTGLRKKVALGHTFVA